MLNAVVFSRQGHSNGFRTTASSFSVYISVQWKNNRAIRTNCFSPTRCTMNAAAAARYHHHHQQQHHHQPGGRYYCLSSCPRIMTLRLTCIHSPFAASGDEAKRNFNNGGGGATAGAAGVGWLACSSFLNTITTTTTTMSCRSFASKSSSTLFNKNHHHNTVSGILDVYMKRREKRKPIQLAVTWNNLGKAIQQNSRNMWERQNFWIDHKASLQILLIHTEQSSIILMDDLQQQ
jgi:hypothetical protein